MTKWLLAALAFAALIAALLFLTTPVASSAYLDCAWFGSDVCVGTPDDDYLDGTGGYDEIRGRDGSDDEYGRGGPDNVYGGPGRDFLKGGNGDDALYGGDGNDDLNVSSDDSGGDYANCGDGDNDEVWADPSDAVDPNCEIVHYVF